MECFVFAEKAIADPVKWLNPYYDKLVAAKDTLIQDMTAAFRKVGRESIQNMALQNLKAET